MKRVLGPTDVTPQQLVALEGKLLHSGSVEVITAPTFYLQEQEWRCLANVEGALCVIAVTLYEDTEAL